jgi:hypothetical protein
MAPQPERRDLIVKIDIHPIIAFDTTAVQARTIIQEAGAAKTQHLFFL